jgi:acyl carrier protein
MSKELFNQTLNQFVPGFEFDPELRAEDIEGWDSITHIKILSALEKAFSIEFSVSELLEMENIGALYSLILEKI